MLIQALCDYAEQQMTEQLPEGWQEQEIHFRIVLRNCAKINQSYKGEMV